MTKYAAKYYSLIRRYQVMFLIIISGMVLWNCTDSKPEKMTTISLSKTKQSQNIVVTLPNKSLTGKSQALETVNKVSKINIAVESNYSLADGSIEATQDMVTALENEQLTTNEAGFDTNTEEPLSPDVIAALNGDEAFDPIDIDFDQPSVTADNVNEIPVGKYTDQILLDDVNLAGHETDFNEDDIDSQFPNNKNPSNNELREFAGQIDQAELNSQAIAEGIMVDVETGSSVGLKEVDANSHPSTAELPI